MNLTANTLKIDDEDGRFVLIIDTDEIGCMTIDIHALALEFESEVRRELRPYALEAEYARMTMPPSYDPSEAYALDDPKHPTYYERMVD